MTTQIPGNHSKRNRIALMVIVAITTLLYVLLVGGKSQALSGSEFNAGRIIDDSVFYNKDAMAADQIQAFLDSKLTTCDTNGTTAYSYYFNPGSGEVNNSDGVANGDTWVTTTRAVYGQRVYNWRTGQGLADIGSRAPYTCLRTYTQTTEYIAPDSGICAGYSPAANETAAQIILKVAQSCGINPQVLLITLQKEQSLITDTWPWGQQYYKAMGMNCPDSALPIDVDANQNGCRDWSEGFFRQVYYGARQFKVYQANPTSYNYRAGRNNTILYHPNGGCGTSNVWIENQATAALYIYTPYRPNQAALDNLYGTGDGCSSYGVRNFWRMFRDWFGSTYGVHYAWSIESFSFSGGDSSIGVGQTETLTLRARNLGLVPWYNHGDHPIRLGTWEPAGRTSSLFGGTRMATMTESVVQPNGIGTFTFQVTPSAMGTFTESMNLVAENHQWLPWTGLRPSITVTAPYTWEVQNVIYDAGTGYMEPGSQQLITVIAKNTGSITWSKSSGPKITLATWGPDRRSAVSQTWMSPTRVTLMNEDTVAPGQTAGFQFYVTMPSSNQYYEQLNLVAEGQTWFNNPGLTLYLQGKSYAWQPLWHSHSTGTANIPRNTEFTLTVKVKNTGSTTWHKNAGYPVRLATTAPQDRGSGLFHSSWIRDTRPAALQENTVLPGQEGTFTFTAKTPTTPGPRNERFSLVAEGITWFNDPGFSIYVNVL